jgi:hypothetical protein
MIARDLRSGVGALEPVGWPLLITLAGILCAAGVVAGIAASIQEAAVVWLALLCLGMALGGAVGVRAWMSRALLSAVFSAIVVLAIVRLAPGLLPRPSREQLALLLLIGLFGVTLQLLFVLRWLVPAAISAAMLVFATGSVYAVASHHATVPTRQAAPAVALPLGLSSRQTAGMAAQLRWLPVPGATGYSVTVGNRTFNSTQPSLTLRNQLAPGQPYRWSVRARLASGLGLASPSSSLRLIPAAVRTWHFDAGVPASSLITVYNAGGAQASVTFSGIPGVTVRRTAAPHTGVEIAVPATTSPLRIAADQPVIVTRITTSERAVHSVYAIPGPPGH